MTGEHRRYLILEQGVGSALFNFVLNGAIAWLMFRSLETVPLWGQQSIAGDTIGTAFMLPFLTCLIVTRLVQGHRARLPEFGWRRAEHRALGLLPQATWARGVVLGAVCLILAAPLALLTMQGLGVEQLGFWQFVAFKASFAAVLAAMFTPVIALCALGDE